MKNVNVYNPKLSLLGHQKLAILWIKKEMESSAFNDGFTIDLYCTLLACAL